MSYRSNSIALMLSIIAAFPAYAEMVPGKGEYLYGPETSEADACRMAEERAKTSALSRVFGEQVSLEQQMSCREITGTNSDYSCELNSLTWSLVEGDIKATTAYSKVVESRTDEKSCTVTLTADVVIPDKKPDLNFQVNATINEKIYRVGDILTMEFEPTAPMHIVVFNWVPHQDRNLVTQIFPNPSEPQGYITKKTSIPSSNRLSDYAFIMLDSLPKDRNFVDKYLIIIATKKPVKWLSKYQLSELKARLREIPVDERRVIKQGYQLIRGESKVSSLR